MRAKPQREWPWSDRIFNREKYRNLHQRRQESDSLAMASVETVMLGAICSCVGLAALGSQLGQ
jgi:hypothetical protein